MLTAYRRHLSGNTHAVVALFNHALNAAQLAFGAFEASQVRLLFFGISAGLILCVHTAKIYPYRV